MTENHVVGVSSIGSGIAQSIVNSLRLSNLPIETVGFGNGLFEYGALDCDLHIKVPSVQDPGYVDELLAHCLRQGVRILIPGLDNELQILAENSEKFRQNGVEILLSDKELVSLCRNKKNLSTQLNAVSKFFLPAFTREDAEKAIIQDKLQLPCIAKPVDGSGSMGTKIITTIDAVQRLPENYILQDLLIPDQQDYYYQEFQEVLSKGRVPQYSELSIQVVRGLNGELLGRLATVNKLKHGVPIEIFPVDRPEIWEAVDTILPFLQEMGWRGPLNIQGRSTLEGIRFFEVNPRFTGITGLRAMLGFNEVEACLRSWLGLPRQAGRFQEMPAKYGLRQIADRTDSLAGHTEATSYHHYINRLPYQGKKKILLTGSTGYLGRAILDFINEEHYKILILTGNETKAEELFGDKISAIYRYEGLSAPDVPWGSVDVLLHCGFARPYRPDREIAHSLAYTRMLIQNAEAFEIPAIVNISSQSVYSQDHQPPWLESSPPAPSSNYGTAKYASELLLQSLLWRKPHISGTSIRLAGLTGGSPGLIPVDLVTRFVQQALRGDTLEIWGNHQFERLDVRDAAEGIVALLSTPANLWEEVYNLGQGETFSIQELAQWTADEVSKIKGGSPVPIIENINETPRSFGMDSEGFYQLTGWKPRFTLRDSIISLIEYLDN